MIPRIGASVTFYGLAVLRQFEVMGIYPLNESVAIGRSRDKLRCLQLLARCGIGLPVTAYTHDPRQAEDIIDLVGGPPVIIKLLEGTQGIGVVLGDTMKSAKSVIEAFQGANVDILVQEFIKEANSTDIRALVIGDKVVAAMKRQGPPGEFRSNLHRGGLGEKVRHHAPGAQRCRPSRAHARPQCLRRRPAPLQERSAGARGQLVAGHRGAGKGDRGRRGRPHDRVPRTPRFPGQHPNQGQGITGFVTSRGKSPGSQPGPSSTTHFPC